MTSTIQFAKGGNPPLLRKSHRRIPAVLLTLWRPGSRPPSLYWFLVNSLVIFSKVVVTCGERCPTPGLQRFSPVRTASLPHCLIRWPRQDVPGRRKLPAINEFDRIVMLRDPTSSGSVLRVDSLLVLHSSPKFHQKTSQSMNFLMRCYIDTVTRELVGGGNPPSSGRHSNRLPFGGPGLLQSPS
jgi:hypothetical protein